MGSVGSSNPNAALKDCSQGICSIYCPQWCYIVYSPPPPSSILLNDDDDSDSAFQFSPLVVAVIGILASTFILVTYYSIISRFCRSRSSSDQNDDENVDLAQVSSSASNSGGGGGGGGLDEALIKSITVCKYTKGGGLVDGNDCSVCLSAFEENESLRLLPKCNHAFHLPCIDPWLRSHSSCPLCRSSVEASVTSVSNVNALEYQQRSRDVVVIVQSSQQHVIVGFGAQVAPVPAKLSEEEGESVEQILNRRLNESTEADLELQQREVVSDIGNRSASVERIDLCSRDGKGSNSETC